MKINDLAKQDFMDYSMEVIKNRAIPAIDGLKPIHTRILYIMQDEGNISSKPTRKCAKLTGSIMGRAHPHGSSSIYEALVRLSQPWKMRYPLVEVQGNAGNIQGDKAAAERYTECRLTPLGESMVKDVHKNCVPMELNYSDEEEIPVLLTSEFPNILCNPSLGIAVSMSSTTLPHNLGEVCDALVAYIQADYKMDIDTLFKYIKGPDFPTGATVINAQELKEIYSKGQGSIKIRSNFTTETVAGKTHIVIHEIPYLVNPMAKIYDKIKKMVVEDGYTDIENIQNNIGNKGFEIRIICARNANVNKVIKDLCSKTGFQSSISMNNTILIDGKPRKLSFIQMMDEYLKFRHGVIIKCSDFDKIKAEARLHILDGLLIALNDIDNVIAIIKSSISKDDARKKLIAKYGFSLEQVNAILDMRLSKLTSMETEEIKLEQAQLRKEIERLIGLINNTNGMRDRLLINQFLAIKNKYNDKRRTVITSVEEQVAEEVETKSVMHLVLNNNTILPLEPFEKLQLNKKGSPYAKQQVMFGYKTTNTGTSYLFDESGKVYKIDNILFDINTANPLTCGAGLVCGLGKLEKDYLITVSRKGIIKKTLIKEYEKLNRPTQAVKIREDDALAFVGCATDAEFLLILGEQGGLIKLAIKDINTTGRVTIGSKGIDDNVVAAAIGTNETKFFTFANGKAKYTLGADYNLTAKGGKGQTITEGTSSIAALVDALVTVEKGVKLTTYREKDLSVKGKTALGAKISDEQIIKTIA